MRLRSILLALVCLPLIILAALAVPILAPALIAAAFIVPGFRLIRHTSDPHCLNLASFHSPHSMTWSWCLSFIRPRSADEGRWFGAYFHLTDPGWRFGFQIARCQIMLTRQQYGNRYASGFALNARSRC